MRKGCQLIPEPNRKRAKKNGSAAKPRTQPRRTRRLHHVAALYVGLGGPKVQN